MVGKLSVPSGAHTPLDHVREMIDQAQHTVSHLEGTGPQALELLHLLDQIVQDLSQLEEDGVDVRAERVRLETIQQQLRQQKGRFLAEVGATLREERKKAQPDRERWWWFLDEARAKQRRRKLRRLLIGGVIAAVLVLAGWLAYDRLIAPPHSVSQALRHSDDGRALVQQGDLKGALTEFEAAVALTPDDPEPWLWVGVIHAQLNESKKAKEAFDTARSLYQARSDFLLSRGQVYMEAGNLEEATDDVERVIAENPQSGQAYYLRASIASRRGDYNAALADLEKAGELARQAGEIQLEAFARVQRAMLMLRAQRPATPSPES